MVVEFSPRLPEIYGQGGIFEGWRLHVAVVPFPANFPFQIFREITEGDAWIWRRQAHVDVVRLRSSNEIQGLH